MKGKKIEWTIEERNVSDLIPADYNPRRMTTQEHADLTASIEEFGTAIPLVVNTGKRNNILIGGHQRATIYKERGIDAVRVAVPSRPLTLAEEKKLNLRLNKNTGHWDYSKLIEIDLETLIDVGFGEEELASLWDDVDMTEDGFDPKQALQDIANTPSVKPGDAYALGSHCLMCANPTDKEAIKKYMRPVSILYLDPPKLTRKQENEVQYARDMIEAVQEWTHQNAHLFLWTREHLISGMVLPGFAIKNICLWIKQGLTINPKVVWSSAYVPCVYATRGTPRFGGMSDKPTTILNKDVKGDNQLAEDVLSFVPIWIANKDTYEDDTPVSIAERPLKRCTAPGDYVYISHARYGHALIACDQLSRKAIVVEPDPINCEVIIRRWEAWTNKKAKKLL